MRLIPNRPRPYSKAIPRQRRPLRPLRPRLPRTPQPSHPRPSHSNRLKIRPPRKPLPMRRHRSPAPLRKRRAGRNPIRPNRRPNRDLCRFAGEPVGLTCLKSFIKVTVCRKCKLHTVIFIFSLAHGYRRLCRHRKADRSDPNRQRLCLHLLTLFRGTDSPHP